MWYIFFDSKTLHPVFICCHIFMCEKYILSIQSTDMYFELYISSTTVQYHYSDTGIW